MILAWLLLLTGLTISAVAIYYSVIGLAAIFAAATIPIYIMGGSLEVAKLVCATWLKANWSRTPVLMKVYMTTAVLVLMFITSMGIFGFLSKAHTDQNLIGGDVQSKIAVYDEQIKTERENIDAARTALSQMDAQVNERLSRSTDDRGAERAVQIRRQQQAERARLQKDIASAQANISRLNQERSPIAAEIRKVEAEVGPIKYIAAFVYGDNPDANLLEKAVTWVIILIVAVFDPLAVIMLLAAQMTFQWFRDEKKIAVEPPVIATPIVPERDVAEEANAKIAEIEKPEPEFDYPEPIQKVEPEKTLLEQHPYLTSGFKHFANLEPMVYKAPEVKSTIVVEEPAPEETPVTEMERPGDYLILPELEEESKKKDLHDQEVGTTNNQDERITYVQNAEQGDTTLWQRLKQKDQMRPKDRLYKEYSDHEFKNIIVDEVAEPELFMFVKETQDKGPKFSNYDHDKLEHFAKRIYELRKD